MSCYYVSPRFETVVVVTSHHDDVTLHCDVIRWDQHGQERPRIVPVWTALELKGLKLMLEIKPTGGGKIQHERKQKQDIYWNLHRPPSSCSAKLALSHKDFWTCKCSRRICGHEAIGTKGFSNVLCVMSCTPDKQASEERLYCTTSWASRMLASQRR